MSNIDTEKLDKVIVGYVEPHIYAFRTGTIPEYTKIGDTTRPVSVRLDEWKQEGKFPDLKELASWSAKINNEDLYFRDYSVHNFLENSLKKHRLTKSEIKLGTYYSNEFFKDTKKNDIDNAINHINNNQNLYDIYSVKDKEIIENHYVRSKNDWLPRPNQQETVDNFVNAVKSCRNKLLMYAVMRFGKSFTSLLCAKEMNAKFVIVVSAKADVKNEWQKNVEIPKNFEQYKFIDSEKLSKDENILDNIDNNNRYVLFLTLQDLQGNKIKDKHKQIFEKKNILDLVIVDETHFGARGEKLGEVLDYDEDCATQEEYNTELKKLTPKVFLHLSGTPYRILMRNEFQPEDIIAKFKYSDIIEEQEKWNRNNLEIEEWENPYFGFPQMIRFALNPNKSSRDLLKKLKEQNKSATLSELFIPKKTTNINNRNYKKFKHEDEVLALLKLIDGCEEEDDFFGFLNYNKLKEGKMCRHIVCVLPYKASCDAFSKLLTDKKDLFINLKNYEIINIAGFDSSYSNIEEIKNKIEDLDNHNKKTISLTCHKMLTGTTVSEWDTMLFFRDTKSPQEYDQATYRIQSQNIKVYEYNNKISKINKKPQTLLVDFSPNRIFQMKENEANVFNSIEKKSGYEDLRDRLEKEIAISPIFVINSNKVKEVTPTDIIDEIRNYSSNRGIIEELEEIDIDLSVLKNNTLKNIFNRENEINSKLGLNIDPYNEDGDNFDTGEDDSQQNDNTGQENTSNTNETENTKTEENSFKNKIKAYHAKLLFYAFLTNSIVNSFQDIINSLNLKDNKRIAKNIGLIEKDLKAIYNYYNDNCGDILLQIDIKIGNINNLANDKSIKPIERAKTGLKRFNRLGVSEIVTPLSVARDMVDLLPIYYFNPCMRESYNILDIASKEGEFAIACVEKFEKNNVCLKCYKDLIYSIPTSSLTYEFTRKVYSLLGLNIDNITKEFNSYDLLKVKKKVGRNEVIDYDKIKDILCQKKKFSEIKLFDDEEKTKIVEVIDMNKINFDAVVGNPPYQEMDKGAFASASPIYNIFVELAINIDSNYITMIMPTRWYAGGKGLNSFRENMLNDNRIRILHDYEIGSDVFPNTRIAGGVCYFLWDKNNRGDCTVFNHKNNETNSMIRPLLEDNTDTFIRFNKAITILRKVLNKTDERFSTIVSSRKPFGLPTDFFGNEEKYNLPICYDTKDDRDLIIIGTYKYKTIQKYVYNNYPFPVGKEYIGKYKIFIPRALDNGFDWQKERLNPIIGNKDETCTEKYLCIGLYDNKKTCENTIKYINTNFFHLLMHLKKVSQDVTAKVYEYVPMQDFNNNLDIDWSQSVADIDKQLYKKYSLSQEEIKFIEDNIKPME